jgi:hypothetical protein
MIRFPWALAVMVLGVVVCGCATVGRTIGVGLVGVGAAMTVTGAVLADGCTNTVSEVPRIEKQGPCMPAATYEKYQPAILTGLVGGLILMGAGVAIFSVSGPPAAKVDPQPAAPSDPPAQSTAPSCTGGQICY